MSKTTFALLLFCIFLLAGIAFLGGFLVSKSLHEHKAALAPIVIHTQGHPEQQGVATPGQEEVYGNKAAVAEGVAALSQPAKTQVVRKAQGKAKAKAQRETKAETKADTKLETKTRPHASSAPPKETLMSSKGASGAPATSQSQGTQVAANKGATSGPTPKRAAVYTYHQPKPLVFSPRQLAEEVSPYGQQWEDRLTEADYEKWRTQSYFSDTPRAHKGSRGVSKRKPRPMETSMPTSQGARERGSPGFQTQDLTEAYGLARMYRQQGILAEVYKTFDHNHQPWYSVRIVPGFGA